MQLTVDQSRQIATALGIEQDGVGQALADLEEAAVEEYIAMLLGRHTPHRVEEIRQYRLYLLIRHLYKHRIPSGEEVGRLFQITPTQGRSLVRNTLAAYRYELAPVVKETLAEPIREARELSDGAGWETKLDQPTLAALNDLLSDIDLSLTPVTRKPGTIGLCRIEPETYQVLKRELLSDAPS